MIHLSEKRKNKRTYPTIRIRVDRSLERVGISEHFMERFVERCWGLSISHLEKLLNSGGIIQFNPSKDVLPENLTPECIISISDKHIKYDKECRFYLIPCEDLVVTIGYRGLFEGKEKPFFWNEWVLMSIWRVPSGIFQEEIRTREFVKVRGRKIYLDK